MKAKGCLITIGILFLISAVVGGISECQDDQARQKREENRIEETKSLSEMLDKNDFKGANKLLSEIYDRGAYKNATDMTNVYIPSAIKVLRAEASYLMSENDPAAEQLFKLCLNDVSANIGKYNVVTGIFEGQRQPKTDKYIDEVTPYNACLLTIIKEALITDNPDFAKTVLSMMKTNYVCNKELREGHSTYHPYENDYTYDYKENNSQIEEAKQLISEYEDQK